MSKLIFPGLIDPHVHLRDPGQTHKEDFYTGTCAALAGGFTTILDMPNNKIPIITSKRLNEKIKIAKEKIVCDVGFYFGSMGDNLEEFKKVQEKVMGLKLYLNETTGNFLIGKDKLKRIFLAWTQTLSLHSNRVYAQKPILLHAEDDILDFAINLTKKLGNKIHICHVSTASDLKQIIKAKNAKPNNLLKGNIITLLFYEPSSRTKGSFDAATKQLGGQTIVIENPQQFSSITKGETFGDTIKTFEVYCDAIVIRHPQVGKAQEAAIAAEEVPIVNAGDGIGEHPTQALLDLYTIFEKTGTLSGLKGLFAGDIKNGRTVHSLLKGLSLYPRSTVYLLSPSKLKLQTDLLKKLKSKGLKIIEIEDTEEIPRDCNFWYWTRVQKERFENPSEYEKLKHNFVVDKQLLNKYGNKDMVLMHPLPRVGEILEEVDGDPRAVYLKNQIRNGMYVRMAIVSLVLGKTNG